MTQSRERSRLVHDSFLWDPALVIPLPEGWLGNVSLRSSAWMRAIQPAKQMFISPYKSVNKILAFVMCQEVCYGKIIAKKKLFLQQLLSRRSLLVKKQSSKIPVTSSACGKEGGRRHGVRHQGRPSGEGVPELTPGALQWLYIPKDWVTKTAALLTLPESPTSSSAALGRRFDHMVKK